MNTLNRNLLFYSVKRFFYSAQTNMHKYVWIDLEMTGLDYSKDKIMEVACIITNPDLSHKHPGHHNIINIDEDSLKQMDDWCTENHGKSGLTEACRKSQITLKDAEKNLQEYILAHTHKEDVLYMAGNSIYVDRLFVKQHMPTVSNMLHYRLVDVSTIKTLCADWYPDQYESMKNLKRWKHRALQDIEDSINELRTYRNLIFK